MTAGLHRAVVAIAALATLLLAPVVRAQVAADNVVIYTLRKGDTLDAIARRYFVSPAAVPAVLRLNRIAQDKRIPTGKAIRIPKAVLRSAAIPATILTFSGNVSVSAGGRRTAVSAGMPIGEGAVIETGSPGFVTVAIPGSSNVTIPSHSRVRFVTLRQLLINDARDIEVAVDQGRIDTRVMPLRQPSSTYRIRTPVSVSAVRGTVFRVAYAGADAPGLTEVIEGAVGVASGEAANPTLVQMGSGAAVKPGGAIVAEALLSSPRMLPVSKLQKEPGLSFQFSPVVGAQAYRTQIARDAGFLDIVADTRTASADVGFDSLEDGDYFVRSMAVAASQLEGLGDAFAFRRRRVGVSGSSELLAGQGYRLIWTSDGVGSPTYRFQLFGPAGTQVPVVDEVGLRSPQITISDLPPGKYSWRVGVRLHSANGVDENWSQMSEFTVSE